MKLLNYSSMLLFDFVTKVFYALLILTKTTWLNFVKVFQVGCVEISNIPAECCDNNDQSNTAGVGVLSEDDAHVNLTEKSAQLSFNTPEVNFSSNVRAEYSQDRNQSFSSNVRAEYSQDRNQSISSNVRAEYSQDRNQSISSNVRAEYSQDRNQSISSNVRAEYSQDRNQSNPFEGHLSTNSTYVNLPARSVQFISTSPEVNVSSNVRAEYFQNRNQSNTFDAGLLNNNSACVNLPARFVQFISDAPEVNASSNTRAECTQNSNQLNTFEARLLNNNGACVNLPARSAQFISSSPEVNASCNVSAESAQNKNQSNTFEPGLMSNNAACVNLPARSTQLFNNFQAVNVSLTKNDFRSVSGQFNKTTPSDVVKRYGGATNFESRPSSFEAGTSQVEADGEVELMPVSERKRFKSARPFYKGITNAAAGSASNHGHEGLPLILTHRKRKFCNPFI